MTNMGLVVLNKEKGRAEQELENRYQGKQGSSNGRRKDILKKYCSVCLYVVTKFERESSVLGE